MRFACYADWDSLPASADALFAESATHSVFLSRPWFENLQNTVPDDDQSMLLACVVEGDRVLAILPLVSGCGQQLHGLTHLYSSVFSLLLVQQNQRAILECLVQGLDQMPIESLRLEPVVEGDRNLQGLETVMQSMGYLSHRRFRFYNWTHRVQGQSFEDYMATRSSRVRNTITRKQRKLQREHGYVVRLYAGEPLDQALRDYTSVYRASWKANELYQEFIEGLVHSFSRPGWLRLAILYVAGKPAAAQFWFVVHRKASIFKLVHDEAWKHYSPGSILLAWLMKHVIDVDKVEEIDFLTGNDAYKQDWMSQRRQRQALSLFKPRRSKGIFERIVDPLRAFSLATDRYRSRVNP